MPETESSCVLEEPRQVVRKFLARPQHEGVGAIVRRSIGRYKQEIEIDIFGFWGLLVDGFCCFTGLN